MSDLTPWFDGDLKPVREGFYDVRTGDGREFRADYRKLGRRIGWWQFVDGGAEPKALGDVIEWRGLASPPETPPAG
jgi:hypothetical protein